MLQARGVYSIIAADLSNIFSKEFCNYFLFLVGKGIQSIYAPEYLEEGVSEEMGILKNGLLPGRADRIHLYWFWTNDACDNQKSIFLTTQLLQHELF